MFYASIDIGSNTTLLLIVEKDKDQPLRVVEDHSKVTGLGREVQKTQNLSPVAMEETHKTLVEYVNICKKYGIDSSQCIVTATQASRVARNAQAFFQSVQQELNLKVNIISSDQEAFYTARGVATFDVELSETSMTIMDIGGASTEFIKVHTSPFKMGATISLPVGSVVCNEWLVHGEFNANIQSVMIQHDLNSFQASSLTCVAGSMTAVAGMIKDLEQFDANLINGFKVNLADFDAFVARLEKLSLEEINKKYPFLEKRSSTVTAGAKLALALCRKVQAKDLRISTYGLRHGSVLEAIHE